MAENNPNIIEKIIDGEAVRWDKQLGAPSHRFYKIHTDTEAEAEEAKPSKRAKPAPRRSIVAKPAATVGEATVNATVNAAKAVPNEAS